MNIATSFAYQPVVYVFLFFLLSIPCCILHQNVHFRHTLFCFLHDSDSQIQRVQVSPIGVIHIMIKQDIVLVSSLVLFVQRIVYYFWILFTSLCRITTKNILQYTLMGRYLQVKIKTQNFIKADEEESFLKILILSNIIHTTLN